MHAQCTHQPLSAAMQAAAISLKQCSALAAELVPSSASSRTACSAQGSASLMKKDQPIGLDLQMLINCSRPMVQHHAKCAPVSSLSETIAQYKARLYAAGNGACAWPHRLCMVSHNCMAHASCSNMLHGAPDDTSRSSEQTST